MSRTISSEQFNRMIEADVYMASIMRVTNTTTPAAALEAVELAVATVREQYILGCEEGKQ